jgi:hypothetical protein
MIVCPHEKGGYAVRPMNWAGIWDENGRLKSTCRFTALFTEKADADEYCRICNDISAFSILSLREELLKHGSLREAFVASIASALKEYCLPFSPEEEVAEKVMQRIIGEEDKRYIGTEMSGSFSCENTEALQELFVSAKKMMSAVDITGYSSKVILQILGIFGDDIEKLVTTDRTHYEMLQALSGYVCIAGDYDKLYGKSVVLDEKKKIHTAKIEFRKGGNDA